MKIHRSRLTFALLCAGIVGLISAQQTTPTRKPGYVSPPGEAPRQGRNCQGEE